MDQEFEVFWKAYPRKVAKADARKAWMQTARVRPDLQTILKAVQAASATDQWMRGGGSFIPHASTWLRGERWEDVHEVKIEGVVNEKPWYETATGIEAKGAEFGLHPSQFNSFPQFKEAVMQRASEPRLRAVR
jgi:hypothetical protein